MTLSLHPTPRRSTAPAPPAPRPAPRTPAARRKRLHTALTLFTSLFIQNHVDIVELLLASQANPNLVDNLNSAPLMEACKAGSDRAIRSLVVGGATWHMGTIDTAAALCTTVFESNLPLLRRYLAAGARADAGDYDAR